MERRFWSSLGAVSACGKNADYTSQNTQQSESNIRDTDIGDEILGYTTNQILVNASQSLLAQYNSSKDAVLVLLR